jgi:hypothetical protein
MPRMKTGVSRPFTTNVDFNADEAEWAARKAYKMRLGKMELIRRKTIPPNYLAELAKLRSEQRNDPDAPRRPAEKDAARVA